MGKLKHRQVVIDFTVKNQATNETAEGLGEGPCSVGAALVLNAPYSLRYFSGPIKMCLSCVLSA